MFIEHQFIIKLKGSAGIELRLRSTASSRQRLWQLRHLPSMAGSLSCHSTISTRSMLKETLPPALEEVFTKYSEPEAVFAALLPAVCEFLQTDRCFLQVRHPHNRLYQVFCWCRSPQFPDLSTDAWQQEDHWEQDDPMFAAALRSRPSIFVEDVETTAPEVLNVNFE